MDPPGDDSPELASAFGPAEIVALKRGDPDALRALHEQFAGPVMAVSMGILRNQADAADATQQTFIKVWSSASTVDPSRSIAPWLFTIARNTAIDVVRAKQRRPHTSFEQVPEQAEGGDDDFEAAWDRWRVRRALDLLPANEREIVYLSYFVGLTDAELAERLELPLGTVKSRARRARQQLARRLRHVSEIDGGESDGGAW